jgi:pilus assembly protein CpaE
MPAESQIRVVVVDDIPETRDNLTKLVMFERDIEIVGVAGSGTEALEKARQLLPDIMLMDINMPDMDGIKATELINSELPNTAVIMMSVQGEQDYLRRSMLAGAREFLVKPFTGDELVESIRKVYKLEQSKRRNVQYAPQQGGPAPVSSASAPQQGQLIVVFSPKGGVGRTTVATNLAVALKSSTNKKVAFVDGSLAFGDAGVVLNLLSNKTLSDLVSRINELDEELLRDVMVTHASGVRVLLAPPEPEEAELVTGQHMTRILGELRQLYDYVIIDTAPTFNEVGLSILDIADRILLVTTLEMPAIRNTKVFLEIVDKLGYSSEKVLLVINRGDSGFGIRSEVVEDTLRKKATVVIPSDGRAVTMAVNQGVPLVISARENRFSKEIFNLAKTLSAGKPVEQPEPTAAAKKQEQPQQQGLLSRFLPARR